MHYMKSDLGGAAAVFGTLLAVAQQQLPVHLVVALPTAENAVSGAAIKPGDVIKSYSGKTIEVIDTDAEGRLILADALAYVNEQYQPDVLIDLATLTGSAVQTLGYEAAALFTNAGALQQQLTEAGNSTHEKVWPLPLWKAYEADLHSDVADVRNYSGKPLAGAIMAAKFLEVFTNKHPQWAHLDIAGTAFGDTGFTKMKSATGYGVNLLYQYLKNLVYQS